MVYDHRKRITKKITKKIYLRKDRKTIFSLPNDIIFQIFDLLRYSNSQYFFKKTIENLSCVNKKMRELILNYLRKKCILFQLYDNPFTGQLMKKFASYSKIDNLEISYLFISILRLIDRNDILNLSGKFRIFGEFVNELFRKRYDFLTTTLEETILQIFSKGERNGSRRVKIFIKVGELGFQAFLEYLKNQFLIYSQITNTKLNFYQRSNYGININEYVFSVQDPKNSGISCIYCLNLYSNISISRIFKFTFDSLFVTINLENEEYLSNEFSEESIIQHIRYKKIELDFSLDLFKNAWKIRNIIRKVLRKMSKGWTISEENYSKIIENSGIKIDNRYLRRTSENMDLIPCSICRKPLPWHIFYYQYIRIYPLNTSHSHVLCYCIRELSMDPNDHNTYGNFFSKINS